MAEEGGGAAHESLLREATDSSVRALLLVEVEHVEVVNARGLPCLQVLGLGLGVRVRVRVRVRVSPNPNPSQSR